MMQNYKLFGEEWRATNPTLCFICQLYLDLLLTAKENQVLGKLDPQRLKVCPQKREGNIEEKNKKTVPQNGSNNSTLKKGGPKKGIKISPCLARY